jgi:1-acyl-sn-glycerol-3-phosphate acyltransferase
MNKFDDIRPYNDSEVAPVIQSLINDYGFIKAISHLRFPRLSLYVGWLLSPIIKLVLKKQSSNIQSVTELQNVVSHYMKTMLDEHVSHFSVSGLDKLDKNKAYLFISNHRDIAMDPAFVNWALYQNGFDTVRIAIGDNLLTKPYVSDLMRLNKSFIVNRSAKTNREKFKASKHLSAYISHSIKEENSNVWIAQREGRAKDGKDETNAAVISMLALNRVKPEPLADLIKGLNIVPVAISYEWDPCDAAKANELYSLRQQGSYEKGEDEDVGSIAAGISGDKGCVHIAFGDVLGGDYQSTEQVAADIDQQIISNYVLHPSNLLAASKLDYDVEQLPYGKTKKPYSSLSLNIQNAELDQRIANIPLEQKEILLRIYANPVIGKLNAGYFKF